MRFARRAAACAALLCPPALTAAGTLPAQEPPGAQRVENLRAFAKLYGYVRFFHPSDEAAAVDWDRFAIYGAGRTKGARSRGELAGTLEELFLPIAPTVQVYPTGEPPEPVAMVPEDTTGLRLVAWQHLGVGLGPRSVYRSKRLNRPLELGGAAFGTVTQALAAGGYLGRRIRLTAFVRAEVAGLGNQAQLWLRVDRPGNARGFFDNMGDRPITSSEWQPYEIIGTVAEDAVRIFFGCFLAGQGRAWVDDFEVEYETEAGSWEPVSIGNPGFEEGDEGNPPPRWSAGPTGYSFEITADESHGGDRALLIEDEPRVIRGPLFDAHSEPGTVVERDLGGGLSARVPLALLGDTLRTWSPVAASSTDSLLAGLASIPLGELTADDEDVRLADVIIAWNVFQHFYPYFDVVEVDWDAQLTRSLAEALSADGAGEFYLALRRLVASLEDGHGNVIHPAYSPTGRLPLGLDWIEDRIVATKSLVDGIEPGDIIERIDGVEARDAVHDAERYISGSPQWKRYRALYDLGAGEVGAPVDLSIRRGSERFDVEVELRQPDRSLTNEYDRESIEVLEDGVYYVDLTRADTAAIEAVLDELASAPGVVFDLRGYPNGNHLIISHLLETPDTSDAWMRVPRVIYPDQEELAGYEKHGWGMPVRRPHIEGPVVFLTNGRAISYAESFMGFIEGYRLAEIVGQPTAGTNGNVNPLVLPGGFRITWTGMKVVKHDGSQHHLIGIQPTVPVERSIEGVREGRDEFLEAALEVIRESNRN